MNHFENSISNSERIPQQTSIRSPFCFSGKFLIFETLSIFVEVLHIYWTNSTIHFNKDALNQKYKQNEMGVARITHRSHKDTHRILTFWRRIFFQILAHPVFKM